MNLFPKTIQLSINNNTSVFYSFQPSFHILGNFSTHFSPQVHFTPKQGQVLLTIPRFTGYSWTIYNTSHVTFYLGYIPLRMIGLTMVAPDATDTGWVVPDPPPAIVGLGVTATVGPPPIISELTT